MDFCLVLDDGKRIDIEDDDEVTVASFRIDEDEQGWRWSLSYADESKATRMGRL